MKGEKACKECKAIAEKDNCPICKAGNLTESWKGKIIIFNIEKSEIAQKLKIKQPGSYAIKI